MKAFTFARNEDDLTDNSRTRTGTNINFRSPSQNSLVLKFPNGIKGYLRPSLSVFYRKFFERTQEKRRRVRASYSFQFSAQYTAILK